MRAVLLFVLLNNIFKLPCAFSAPELPRLAPQSGSNATREAAARPDDHRREELAVPAPQQPRGRLQAATASQFAAADAAASKRSAAGHAGSTHGPTLAQPSALLPLSNATLLKDRQLQRLADRWRLTRAQAAQIGQPEAEGKLRICISSFTPEVYCTAGEPPSTYSGYQIELFRAVSASVYWLSDPRAWTFSCIGYTELLADLNSPNGTCLIAPAAVSAADVERPSWVVDKESLRILIMALEEPAHSLFSPFEALSWQLWLSLAATAVFVGGAVVCCDVAAKSVQRPALKRHHRGVVVVPPLLPAASLACAPPDAGANGAATAAAPPAATPIANVVHVVPARAKQHQEEEPSDTWALRVLGVRKGEEEDVFRLLDVNLRRALLKFARMSDPPITTSLPAQAILFTYGILLIIIVAVYTAGTAARLTAAQLTGGIRGRDDLKGRAVGTWTDYQHRLSDQGIEAIGIKWDTIEDEGAMLNKLRKGSVAALVLNRNFVDYTASTQCEFAAVGLPFGVSDNVFGLALNMQAPLVEDINKAIREMVEEGRAERLRDIHVLRLGSAGCKRDGVRGGNTITLEQMAGLWVMMGLGVLVGSLILACLWLQRRRREFKGAAAKKLLAGARFGGSRLSLLARRSSRGQRGGGGKVQAAAGVGGGAADDECC